MREDRETHHMPRAPLLHPRDLLAAIGLLTIVPLARPAPRSEAFARATLWFPCVGLLLGTVLAAANWTVVSRLPPWVSSVLLVAIWEALTGHNGAPTVPRLLSVLIKIVGLAVAPAARPAALLFAPLLARWGMVVLATGGRDADAPGRKFNAAITFRDFALTSVFTLAAVFTVAEAFGILIVVCAGALALGLRLYAHRRAGGISWPFLVTGMLGFEALVVAVCAIM